ncbi:unnamed protein product [Cladocopium goreaui]|uniref:PX domain-containing protein n=1 Tax=Cladocopium goreaui TaxID=2562237 RepID=A0A9P1CRU7_9DINO|nr:unnamed protein product [Cladocopium goreaui]
MVDVATARIVLGSEVECEANCGQEQLDLLRRFHLGIPALLGQGRMMPSWALCVHAQALGRIELDASKIECLSVAKLPGLERVLGGMLDPIGLYNQQMEVIDAFPFPESCAEKALVSLVARAADRSKVIISPIRTAATRFDMVLRVLEVAGAAGSWLAFLGYTLYDPNPLTKTSFRPSSMPAYRDDFQPLGTAYGERPQGYGCHRNPAWDETLRLPRNPFPGSRAREMTYLREFAEIGLELIGILLLSAPLLGESSHEEELPASTLASSSGGYGCHRNLIWDESLRMPRNPFAGKPNREMTYIKEVPLSTPRRLAQWDMQRTMRGASTPRKNFTPMLPELNQRHRDVLDKSADELAQMMKLFED